MASPPTGGDPVAESVRRWYDEHGWQRDEATGLYRDTATFSGAGGSGSAGAAFYESSSYHSLKPLFTRGRFFLDAASGALAHLEYLEWSRDYGCRICVDISGVALREARRKLKGHGVCLQADVARLPLRDAAVDGGISAYTVQHVAAERQLDVLREFYRVMAPGSRFYIITGLEPSLRRWCYALLRGVARRITYKAKHRVSDLYYCGRPPGWWKWALREIGATGDVRTLRLLRPVEYRLLFGASKRPASWLRAVERTMPRLTLPLAASAVVTIEKPRA
jgi:SAM-dependent methyltransferase